MLLVKILFIWFLSILYILKNNLSIDSVNFLCYLIANL